MLVRIRRDRPSIGVVVATGGGRVPAKESSVIHGCCIGLHRDADRRGGRRDEEECGQNGPSIAFAMAVGGAIVGIVETTARPTVETSPSLVSSQ